MPEDEIVFLPPGSARKLVKTGEMKIISLLPPEFEGEKPRWIIKSEEKSPQELEAMLRADNIQISSRSLEMIHSSGFITLKKGEEIYLVDHSAQELGLTGGQTTAQILKRGFELYDQCPAEAAVYLRRKYKDQPEGEWIATGMKPITERDGRPRVFGLERNGGKLWLYNYWAYPGYTWNPDDRFVFRLRKPLPSIATK